MKNYWLDQKTEPVALRDVAVAALTELTNRIVSEDREFSTVEVLQFDMLVDIATGTPMVQAQAKAIAQLTQQRILQQLIQELELSED